MFRRAALGAAAALLLAAPARADFFDDVRRTFEKDIPRTFEHDIPRAFGATPRKDPAPVKRGKPPAPAPRP
ncbi:MAG: hypothetical protein NVSMB18_08060 [Acetobacteraceae bacterium]